MCHAGIESVDHLFLQCCFASQIWDHFSNLLHLPEQAPSMGVLWDSWRSLIQPAKRDFGDLVVKAFVWNIWLAKNDRIFNANTLSLHVIILKIDRILLSWFSTFAEGLKGKLEESMMAIRRSLEFFGPRVEESSEVPTSEEVQDLSRARLLLVPARESHCSSLLLLLLSCFVSQVL